MKKWENKIGQVWTPDFSIPSGSFKLDNSSALENYRGIPSGSMIQISSAKEGCFKTTLALMGARELQKRGDKIVYIDAEAGITGDSWLHSMGIDTSPELWVYAQPENGEEAFEMCEHFIKDPTCKGIILDSIDASQPSKIMESEFGDANIGNHAKLVTQAVRKFKTLVRTNQKILWLVNQEKAHITNMGARGTKPTGGFAIGFYCKLNIEMSRTKSDSQLIGTDYIPLKMRVGRSKLGKSYIDVETYALQGVGIDRQAELVDYAEELGIIKKAGSWWKVGDEAIGQGMESARSWVVENEELILEQLNNDLDTKEKETIKEN